MCLCICQEMCPTTLMITHVHEHVTIESRWFAVLMYMCVCVCVCVSHTISIQHLWYIKVFLGHIEGKVEIIYIITLKECKSHNSRISLNTHTQKITRISGKIYRLTYIIKQKDSFILRLYDTTQNEKCITDTDYVHLHI